VEFITGSTRNGSIAGNTHQFTGSVLMSGSLGIGTSSPSAQIHIVGNSSSELTTGVKLVRSEQAGQYIVMNYESGIANFTAVDTAFSGPQFRFNTSTNGTTSTDRIRITSSGSVGIGTTSPLSTLVVSATNSGGRGGEISITNPGTAVSSEAALNFGFGTSTYNGDAGNAQIKALMTNVNEATDMVFSNWSGASFIERMRITSAGLVGIGVASPSVLLHVSGTMYATKIGSTNSTPAIQVRGPGGGPRIQTYGLDADSRAWMGLGTDMAGNPYEHSLYFSAPDNAPSAGMQTIGSYDGTTYSVKMTILRNGSIGAPTGTNIYNPSDARLKQNISTTTYGLAEISALNPVKFNWIDNFVESENGKDMLGFIAQEVQTVIPEAIESFGSNIDLNGTTIDNPLRVNEKFIIPILVKAIQELKAEIEILKQQ
jgi:hypothetical protein